MKAIIYVRVSSDEQVKGTSLESQEEKCRAYCASKDIEVVKIFREEGESAKNANRTELLRSLEFLRTNKGKIGAFVVWKLDRFARNAEDHFAVKKTLTEYGVVLYSVTEPIGTGPTEKLMETMLAGFAEFDNEIRKLRCTDGMAKKIEQGLWPWFPPLGYKCSQFKKRGSRKTGADPIDPETAPLIKRAFTDYLTGLYSTKTIALHIDQWGMAAIRGKKTSKQFIDRMLGNPFYAGILVNPWNKKEIKGIHEPLITEEEYRKVQLIKQGRGYGLVGKRLHENPDYPLRKTALCGQCGGFLTGAWTTGTGGRYPYYRCYNSDCVLGHIGIPRKNIENAFVECLKGIAPKAEFMQRLKEKVSKILDEKYSVRALETEQHEKRLAALEIKKKKIYEMREDGSYTKEEFLQRKEEIENQITVEKISLSESRIGKLEIENALAFSEKFFTAIWEYWRLVPDTLKPRFQKLVFPEGIQYFRNRGFGTAKTGVLFELSRQFEEKNCIDVAGDRIALSPRGYEPREVLLLHPAKAS